MFLIVFPTTINKIPTRYQQDTNKIPTRYQQDLKTINFGQFSLLSRFYKIFFINTAAAAAAALASSKKSTAFYSQSASNPLLTPGPAIRGH
jgi:hypothetical protein